MTEDSHCPLCSAPDAPYFFQDQRRYYRRCETCLLVFVPPPQYMDLSAERAEYDKHHNEVDDPGYRKFLSRLCDPLLAELSPNSKGLDFGCGPGPALAQMLSDAGHDMTLYDPYYADDPSVLEQRYDFICATEVVEHLHRPRFELARLWGLLSKGGYLGVMTKLVIDLEAFSQWHYKNDLTHVCFFSRESWQWWADHNKAQLRFVGSDVILLRR